MLNPMQTAVAFAASLADAQVEIAAACCCLHGVLE